MYNSKNVDPAKHKENIFELYSVPVFPTDTPEIVKGEKIGSAKQSVENGDVLLCKINPKINRVWFVKNRTENAMIASSEWIVVRNKFMLTDYLVFCFMSPYFRDLIENNVSGVGGSLTRAQPSMVATYTIPIPPFHEQERIVEEIKHWFELIDVIEQSKEDLQGMIKETKSKILDLAIHGKLVPQDPTDEPATELLKRINPKAEITCDNPHYRNNLPKGWAVTTIKDMCENINGLWKGKKGPFVNVGVIRNANFTKDFKLDYSKIEYIDVEQRAFNQRHLKNGDLIVEKSGGSDNNPVGRAILYEGKDSVFSFSNFTMALRIKEKEILTSRYLYYFLLAEYRKGSMRLMQTQTTGLHNLILDKYMSMPVLLPPFSEQLHITEKIEELFGIMDAIKANL